MKNLVKVIAIGVIGLAATTGCIIPKMSHGKIKGWYVIVPHGHIHSDHCGHYRRGADWYMIEGHRHGPGCGHHHRGGHWCDDD